MLHSFFTTRLPQGEKRNTILLLVAIYPMTMVALFLNAWLTPAASAPAPAPVAQRAVSACGSTP